MAIQKIPNTLIADNAITATKIANGTLTADDIAANSITAAKLSASTSPTFGGLTVDGAATIDGGATDNTVLTLDSSTANTYLKITDSNSTNGTFIGATTNDLNFYPNNTLSAKFASGGDISFYEDTGTTAKFFWDASAEKLGVGESNPSDTLELGGGNIVNPNSTGSEITSATLGIGQNIHLEERQVNGAFSDRTDLAIVTNTGFGLGESEKIRIEAGGNVGIGTTNISAKLHVEDTSGDDLGFYVFKNGRTSAKNYSSSDMSASSISWIQAQENNTSLANTLVMRQYDAAVAISALYNSTNTGSLAFGTNNGSASVVERMRIDASGNLLVGTTDNVAHVTSSSGEGIALSAGSYGGFIGATRNQDVVMQLNRTGNDGDIVRFAKDGSTVGSIGTEGTDLTIGSGGAGFQFLESENKIRPFNVSTNSASNGVVDLGRANAKFKDLYLSGAIKMSSDLDDYEEGTWTPSFQSDGSTTYTVQVGTYTKVGNLVTAWFHIDINVNGATSSQSLIIAGLPFASIITSENYGATGGLHCNQWSTSTKPDNALISPGANVAAVYKSNGQAGLQIPTHADIGGGNMLGFLIYRAA